MRKNGLFYLLIYLLIKATRQKLTEHDEEDLNCEYSEYRPVSWILQGVTEQGYVSCPE